MRSEPRAVFMSGLHGGPTLRPAVGSVTQTATYEQMHALGANWPEAHNRALLMAQLAEGAHSIVGFDAVKVPFCQTIEAEALGCEIKPGDKEHMPSIAKNAFHPEQTPSFPKDFLQRKRVPVLLEAVKILKKEIGNKVAIVGGVIAPFSVAAQLIGPKLFLKLPKKNPAVVGRFMEIATQSGIELARALLEAGVDAICVENMMASGDMISPAMYKGVGWFWDRELIRNIKAPTILHICGDVEFIVKEMIETGTAAVSFEPKTSIASVKKAVRESNRNVGLIGGIDAMDHLFYSQPHIVKAAARKAVDDGYSVVAPSCSVPPTTTTANLKAIVEGAAA